MAIAESGVLVCPKAAQVNKASFTRQTFYQIKLVKEKQDRKYYTRFLPEIIFFLYAAGKNVVDITLKPFIVRSTCVAFYYRNATICDDLGSDPEAEDMVQKRAALFLMVNQFLVYGPAVLQGIVCGEWSDRNGRKLPMMIPSLGIIIAALFYGMFGKTAVFTMALYSYVSETTAERRRTKKFTSLMAFKYLGCFAGAFMSGFIVQLTNSACAFSTGVMIHAICVTVIFFYIKENVITREHKLRLHQRQGKTCMDVFLSSGVVLWRKRQHRGRTAVVCIFIIALFYQSCQTGHQENLVLFVNRAPLSWPPSLYGYLVSFSDLATGLGLIVLAPMLLNCCEARDTLVLCVALACIAVRGLCVGLAFQTWMVFAAVGIGSFGGIVSSVLKSMASKCVDLEEQGQTFALFAGTETVAKILGSVGYTCVYSLTSDIFSGFLFLFMSGISACMIPLVIVVHKCRPKRRPSVVENFSEDIEEI
ncbi:hypothetical protein BaRGS_00009640 [Batillaria attramentaria]|uniref:Proton-coupled folate transporter n=1 Tax=Batillaria attramentaria TaxID=370345 RepID=A0ABD0LIX4_9CAEN